MDISEESPAVISVDVEGKYELQAIAFTASTASTASVASTASAASAAPLSPLIDYLSRSVITAACSGTL